MNSIPFSAWDVDANPPVRLAVGHMENVAGNGLVDGKYWPPRDQDQGVDNAAIGEWFFIFDRPYSDPAPDPALTLNIFNHYTPMMWFGLPTRRATTSWAAGDQFEIIANHVNGPAHTFTFTPRAPTVNDPAIAKADVTRINVFPNPYQSFDRGDPTRFTQEVTFTHPPVRAIIRIYTLAGIMVKSILKEDPGQFARWDIEERVRPPGGSRNVPCSYTDARPWLHENIEAGDTGGETVARIPVTVHFASRGERFPCISHRCDLSYPILLFSSYDQHHRLHETARHRHCRRDGVGENHCHQRHPSAAGSGTNRCHSA